MTHKIGDNLIVTWQDAVIYHPPYDGTEITPTATETSGILVKKTDEYIILKNTVTKILDSESREKNTYSYIPQGMIEEIKIKEES